MNSRPNRLDSLGVRLTIARKRGYPKDTQSDFALRIGVSRATYTKMEKGDLSVGLDKYYKAAQLLELTDGFEELFVTKQSILDL